MQKLRVMIGEGTNPFLNLATENWIFRELDPSYKTLFLWRNCESVIIGRFQNPWTECNLKKMQEDNVLLVRRQSGGGAVFHDLGNTNFTFCSASQTYDKQENFKIIQAALKSLGVSAQVSGRNDMVIEDTNGVRKFSGSAFKTTRDRAFHHGTLLIDANLSKLQNYLNPDPRKLESKGIKSVRSRVINLKELQPTLTHELVTQTLIRTFFDFHGNECPIEVLRTDELKNNNNLHAYYQELENWNWRFGETPKFMHCLDHRFEWGGIELYLNSKKGIIENAKIFSDCLFPEMIEALQSELIGEEYSSQILEKKRAFAQDKSYHGQWIEVINWLQAQL